MKYKGYTSSAIDFDEEDKLFSGTIDGIKDVVHFAASSADDLVQAFHDSVDDYLTYCQERGEEPDKPFNGRILLRTSPELHRKAAMVAAREGLSLSKWLSRIIDRAA
ncbi:type II toxin-antitoxin system HicB family antitoxin [Rhodospirillum rubrum]|uniref:HicB n=1 Tax=Rhodospirillum rubrum (strain ATCC 11170 / ATH 1.1.1 / DSM 467 / LMG 4362 / NCIMB 8255 / S1) TaxID=269796 RepID=Q2RPF3_RHORT|nr:type II toxin-antitoxin system HicB family antitoxin [Rhodospirillum rubrum]ABC23992.1 HicB [Rhodospirillum rubrum ATCC 11170]AEO49737.1 HicB [Rhodospirillum rubrum F11]MBK5955676.1 toxin-antitoxin system HicB family antitoxin [Rhodospirillum rubrum]QXG79934.1 type II toxin-antitoxin system HicB family antitoxin [Rhodospirillum rubrum]HAQ00708.1 type II toxin-antitoxin system HicB family antitoxin [Rhodospirillum rubrum]